MKKYFFSLLLMMATADAYTQHFFTSFFIGASNYQGDLSAAGDVLTRARPAFGAGAVYELNDRMLIRGDFTYGSIAAADRNNPSHRVRNLDFKSNIAEFSLGFEYLLFNLYDYKVSPYFFLSVARFGFKPVTKDVNGNNIILPDFNTEGQGFYLDRKPYKLRQYAVPFGGGLQWAVSEHVRLGWVIGIRKTFTDYLDDVSTTYAPAGVLAVNRGQGAVAIAFRGDDLPGGGTYPAENTARGNPGNQDWYYFGGVTARVRVPSPKGHYRRVKKLKSSVGCPRL